jgi:hypothetical protein
MVRQYVCKSSAYNPDTGSQDSRKKQWPDKSRFLHRDLEKSDYADIVNHGFWVVHYQYSPSPKEL